MADVNASFTLHTTQTQAIYCLSIAQLGERGRREGWMDGGLTSDTEEGISRCVGALCVGCHAAISPPAGEAHLRDGEH